MRMRTALAPVLLAALVGCGGHGSPRATPTATPRAAESATGAGPQLVTAGTCRLAPGFKCFTLAVPLDHSGRTRGELRLAVALQPVQDAPRGVLLALTGGPGQPGVPFAPSFRRHLGRALRGYQLVLLDQRGTGRAALRCPPLQRSVGASDLTVPAAGTVERCADTLGAQRRFFTTADTVADLELLREALGVDRLALDGVSYGTYVAERYALAHPDRVDRLVLDSVVAHDDLDPLSLVPMRATARVLRAACRRLHCPTDPANDLAAVVRQRHDGPELLDTLTAFSIAAPGFRPIPGALRSARAGQPRRLDRIVAAVRRGQRFPAGFLSQGLHASTLCGDLRTPWGNGSAPLAGRRARLAQAVARLEPSDVFPFDRATAAGNGIVQTCLRWPPVPVPPLPPRGRNLPPVPVLLLSGDRDLSTPLEWARAEAARAPRGHLVVVPGAGHSTQSRGGPVARRAVAQFLQE
jgi:pimeloyl-ACP methyl ester carboxylesterase